MCYYTDMHFLSSSEVEFWLTVLSFTLLLPAAFSVQCHTLGILRSLLLAGGVQPWAWLYHCKIHSSKAAYRRSSSKCLLCYCSHAICYCTNYNFLFSTLWRVVTGGVESQASPTCSIGFLGFQFFKCFLAGGLLSSHHTCYTEAMAFVHLLSQSSLQYCIFLHWHIFLVMFDFCSLSALWVICVYSDISCLY